MLEISYDIHDASKATGVPAYTLKKFIQSGELPIVKIGRSYVIRRSTLDEFLSKFEVPPVPEDTSMRGSNETVLATMEAAKESSHETS